MDNTKAKIIAAVLTTLAEMPKGYVAREGLLYAPFMAEGLDVFMDAMRTMVSAGFIKLGPVHAVKITDDGRAMAAEIEALFAAKKEGDK